jgi:serine/threonine protein kinase
MSPEQAYDPRLADARSDIYSLGCTLHYLLTGKAPYGGQGFMERLIGHRERPIPSLRKLRKEVPDALDDVFRRLMSKSPEGRPQTMFDVIEDLEACRALAGRASSRSPAAVDEDDPDDDGASVYEVADLPAAPQPRPLLPSTVYARSPGSSSDRIRFRSESQAQGRRMGLIWFFAVIGAIVGGLYLAVRWARTRWP